ncbi:MAG: PAS domain-containing sensor histidine kinase [Bdellovibrionia bacterium]
MSSLPSLRRKIHRRFLMIIALYGVLGFALVTSVFFASGTTPKLLHLNYDSISVSNQMKETINALEHPQIYPSKSLPEWTEQFEKALEFEERNITEPGEKELVTKIRTSWDAARKSVGTPTATSFHPILLDLDELVKINERGMFKLAQENETLNRQVIIGSVVYFIISLLLAAFIADGLADRLASPLKSIAEALHQRPSFSRKLRLPDPTSLEMFVLSAELYRLFERLAQSEKVNVAEIVQQKLKLETVLESIEDALVFLDLDQKVSHCNVRLSTIVGLTESQIQGQLWRDLPSVSDNYLKLRELLKDDLRQGQEIEFEVGSGKFQYSARSRDILTFGDSAGPGATGGVKLGTLFLLHDITEKRHREKFRSDFMDLLSHELKTPLQSLGIASQLLIEEKDKLPKEMGILAETISEDVERIRAVAQEFVQVTFNQTKILKLQFQLVPLSQTLPEWLKPFYVLGRDRQVKVEFLNEGSEMIWANLDSTKFPWVISNLVSNAIRFSPPSSTVRVVLTDRNGAVEMQVKDEGSGIPEQDQKHIFDPFFQGSASVLPGQRGLFGIGLTIAKDVVEAHDGRIEYYPRLPQGSEFRIILPFPPLHYGVVPS